jgi:hypothetical protein
MYLHLYVHNCSCKECYVVLTWFSQHNFKNQNNYISYSDSWPVRMGPIRCPETSVNNYHTTPRNTLEDRTFQIIYSLRVSPPPPQRKTLGAHLRYSSAISLNDYINNLISGRVISAVGSCDIRRRVVWYPSSGLRYPSLVSLKDYINNFISGRAISVAGFPVPCSGQLANIRETTK